MKDLTRDPIEQHIATLAAPAVITLITQLAHQLIDLYFITRLGVAATAGANAAGNATLCVAALAQVLTVGAAPLIGQAVGRGAQHDANAAFNQSLALSALLGVLLVAVIAVSARAYLRSVAADDATVEAGLQFLLWMLPGLAVVLPTAALASALRSTGSVRPNVVIATLTVGVNALLAPVLIAGWGTGVPLGVRGAGLATTIANLVGAALFTAYFWRSEQYLKIRPALLRPRLKCWRRMLGIGMPAGAEFALMFLSIGALYYFIRDFGTAAQAGFSIGWRVLQIVLLPGMAIGFAVGPIAAQNFGAGDCGRVREAFWKASLLVSIVTFALALLLHYRPGALLGMFSADQAAITTAALFLQSMSWCLVAQSLVYVCIGMFQGLGNTVPALVSATVRLLFMWISALWLSTRPSFAPQQVWQLLAASVTLQAVLSVLLLRIELKKRLASADHYAGAKI